MAKQTSTRCEVAHCRNNSELTHIPLKMRLCYPCYEKHCNGQVLVKVGA